MMMKKQRNRRRKRDIGQPHLAKSICTHTVAIKCIRNRAERESEDRDIGNREKEKRN